MLRPRHRKEHKKDCSDDRQSLSRSLVHDVSTENQKVYLLSHGETEWSLNGRHTGVSDIPLTENGRRVAQLLQPILAKETFALVLTSPMQRARETCEIAGLGKLAAVEPKLAEWNYGEYEGLTTQQIRMTKPSWSIFRDGAPGGHYHEVCRAEPPPSPAEDQRRDLRRAPHHGRRVTEEELVMAVQHAQAERAEDEQRGAGEEDPDEQDRQLTFRSGESRSDRIDEKRRREHTHEEDQPRERHPDYDHSGRRGCVSPLRAHHYSAHHRSYHKSRQRYLCAGFRRSRRGEFGPGRDS